MSKYSVAAHEHVYVQHPIINGSYCCEICGMQAPKYIVNKAAAHCIKQVTYQNCTFADVLRRAKEFQVEFKVVDKGNGRCRFVASSDYHFTPDVEATRFANGLEFESYYCAYEHIGAYC